MLVARARVGLHSWDQVALRADISPATIERWIYGQTRPAVKQLAKVAAVLNLSAADLEAAYEGVSPPEPPLADAVRELVPQLRALVEVLRSGAEVGAASDSSSENGTLEHS